MASYLTLPFRPAPLEGSLIPTIERGLAATDRIGQLGEHFLTIKSIPSFLMIFLSKVSLNPPLQLHELMQERLSRSTLSLSSSWTG